jgi:hypothetical protein
MHESESDNVDTDWQHHIHGIGLHEFVLQDSTEAFTQAVDQYCTEEAETWNFGDIESKPHVPQFHGGRTRQIDLPDEYNHCFEEIYLSPITETNEAVRLTVYGTIDGDRFHEQRGQIFDQPDYVFDEGNAGLEILRTAEDKLSEFLAEEIGVGMYTEMSPTWSGRGQDAPAHPAFWYYDFDDTECDSAADLAGYRDDGGLYLGLGGRDRTNQQLTEYSEGRCALAGDGRKYFSTRLGSFPFRYIIFRFGKKDYSEDLPFRFDPSDGSKIPAEAANGAASLGRIYLYLGWALKVYHDLDAYQPLKVFEETDDVAATLHSLSDSEKSAHLDRLYEQSRAMHREWTDAQGQFESIHTSLTEFGTLPTDSTAATEPIRSAGETIEGLCRDRVERYDQQYDRLIDQVKDTLDANISVFDKRLSIAVLLVGIPTAVLQLYDIWDVSRPGIATLIVMILYTGAFVVLFSDLFDS